MAIPNSSNRIGFHLGFIKHVHRCLFLFAVVFVYGCTSKQNPTNPVLSLVHASAPLECVRSSDSSRTDDWEYAEKHSLIYPQKYIDQGHEGWTIVRFTIEANGTTSEIEVLESGAAGVGYSFDEVSIKNIEQLKYRQVDVNATPKRTPDVIRRLRYDVSG